MNNLSTDQSDLKPEAIIGIITLSLLAQQLSIQAKFENYLSLRDHNEQTQF